MIEMVVGVALFSVLGALADRLRGTDKLPALASKCIYAIVAAGVVVSPENGLLALAAFVSVFVAGSSYGWGRPLGLALGGQNNPEPERWQKGPLMDTNKAVVARGFMWLTPVAPMFFVTGNPMFLIAPVVMAGAFTAAPYIAKRFPMEKRWAYMEYIRGGVFLGLTTLLSFL